MEKREYVQFFHNQAVRLSLKFPEGVMKDWGYGMRVMYTVTEDGLEKVMFLDTDVAAKINLAEIQPGQDFWLCKRKGPGKKTKWDLYLEDPTPARHETGIEETGLERDLRLSIHQAQQKRNGHTPPAPVTAPRPAPLRQAPAEVTSAPLQQPQPTRQLARAPEPQQRPPWHDFMVEQANCLTDVYFAVLSHARTNYGTDTLTPELVEKLVVTTYIQHTKGGRG